MKVYCVMEHSCFLHHIASTKELAQAWIGKYQLYDTDFTIEEWEIDGDVDGARSQDTASY